MTSVPESPFLVPFDGSFRVAETQTRPSEYSKSRSRKRLQRAVAQLDGLQRLLYANAAHAVLLVFQGMDAAGKDGTIRAVMSGINPTGCQAHNFRKPTAREMKHDFLWRSSMALPERGLIGIFNRSHYEEVLAVRVHPEVLEAQHLVGRATSGALWDERLESIRDYEKHLAQNGTIVLKFWLNVSPDQQKKRFLNRLDEPAKHWKFNPDDIRERPYWTAYMKAYEDALNATSRPWAPWYAIPADRKPYMRAAVAEIVVAALSGLDMTWPEPDPARRLRFAAARRKLETH